MDNDIAIGVRGLGFDSRDGQIRHIVAQGRRQGRPGPPNQHAWPPQLTSSLFWRQRLVCLTSSFGLPDKRSVPLSGLLWHRLWGRQRLTTAAMFLQSCVAQQVLSWGVSLATRYTRRRNSANIMKIYSLASKKVHISEAFHLTLVKKIVQLKRIELRTATVRCIEKIG